MQNDRRGHERAAVLKGAKITFGNPDQTYSVIDCVILNISSAGARVRTPVPVTIPEWVLLVLGEDERLAARRCWARGNEIGFEFAQQEGERLLDAMISGLTLEQRRALMARIEASLAEDGKAR